ncbi:MAG: host attachment protein [Deltaproteobacteria bacterium]|nr:host attachment protein [Deltaproteobacteria bacterium]
MISHWVLVADAARARTFAADLMLETLLPLEGRVHPQSRVKVKDLVESNRGAQSAGGQHGRFERHTDPHDIEADRFARELAEMLTTARAERRFERLVLVAPPAFLGRLRAELDGPCGRSIVAEIAHDWTTLSTDELAPRVRQAVLQSQQPMGAET